MKLFRKTRAFSSLSADYIIVGAGCLLANRLSQNESKSVLLIEAGGSDNSPLVNIPVGYLYAMTNQRTSWGFETTLQPGLGHKSIKYPRGKVLGGCSSINGMIFMTGTRQDYDTWSRDFNCPGWESTALENLFTKFVNFELSNQVQGQIWGKGLTGGSVDSNYSVQDQRLKWDVLERVIDACQELDVKFTKNFNSSEDTSCGYFQVNQNKGWRVNSYKAFIKPIKHRLKTNLQVITNSQVQKVIFDSDLVARGIEIKDNSGHIKMIQATKEVILSAGSIGSPQILQLSGIGSKSLLDCFEIPCVVDNDEVGQNLQDHLQIRTVFKVNKDTKTLNTLYHSLLGKMQMGAEYVLNQSGPLSMAPSQLGIFMKSSEKKNICDLQFHVQPLSLDNFGDPLHQFPAITLSVCNLKPTSRGSVEIISKEAEIAPKIDPKYLTTDEDLNVAVDSIKKAREVMNTSVMSHLQPEEYFPGSHLQSEEELRVAAGLISSSIFHPVGTCRMTDDPGFGVVDSKLRVKGVKNLRIVDASIMPEITAGNTNTPTLLIAERAAEIISQRS